MSILDQIKNGIGKVKDQQREQVMKKLDLVPVIFANGEDNDVPGLLAACHGQRVLFKDKIYEPTENILFDYEIFAIKENLAIRADNGALYSFIDIVKLNSNFTVHTPTRNLIFNCCQCNKLPCVRM